MPAGVSAQYPLHCGRSVTRVSWPSDVRENSPDAAILPNRHLARVVGARQPTSEGHVWPLRSASTRAIPSPVSWLPRALYRDGPTCHPLWPPDFVAPGSLDLSNWLKTSMLSASTSMYP